MRTRSRAVSSTGSDSPEPVQDLPWRRPGSGLFPKHVNSPGGDNEQNQVEPRAPVPAPAPAPAAPQVPAVTPRRIVEPYPYPPRITMAGTPAPRRSTRATSRASLEPAPVTTPAPAPRRGRPAKAATPLPTVQTAPNQAYGAAGRINLDSQLAQQSADDAFSALFNANRDAAVARDIGRDDSPPADDLPDYVDSDAQSSVAPGAIRSRQSSVGPINTSGRRGRTTFAHQSVISEEDEDDLSQDDQRIIRNRMFESEEPLPQTVATARTVDNAYSITDLNSTFSYIAPGTGGPITGTPALRGRESSIAAAVEPPATNVEIANARPWIVDVLVETIPRWFEQLSNSINLRTILLFTIMIIALWLGSGSQSQSILEKATATIQQIQAMPGALVDSIAAQAAKARDAAVQGGNYDKNLYGRVNTIENDLGLLRTANDLNRDALNELKQLLPEQLIVYKNQDTGRLQVPEPFWQALQEKLSSEYESDSTTKQPSGSASSWDAFITNNKAKIIQLIHHEIRGTAHTTVASEKHIGSIITKDEFLNLIEENNNKFRQQMKSFEDTLSKRVERIAKEATTAALSHRPQPHILATHYLEDIALLNIARNHDLLMKTVNYFSSALGAVVDPYITSPTYVRSQKTLVAELYTYMPWVSVYRAHPPSSALERWDEVADCWCSAASSDKGQAQLGVIMPRSIVPTSITIEHMPSSGTFDISAAPQEFEVWVYAPELAGSAEQEGLFPRCLGTKPADGYLCIGTGRYNVHATNHVQNFPLYAGVDVGLVQKAVFRVVNNWGQDWTCLYRVRMHGKSEEEVAGLA